MECDTGDCVSFTFSDLCPLILKPLVIPGAICGSLANSQHWGVGLPRVWTDIILRDGLCQEWLILAGDPGSSRRDTWGARKSPCNVCNPAWTDSSCRVVCVARRSCANLMDECLCVFSGDHRTLVFFFFLILNQSERSL